uniref:TraC conjugal transfer protein n=1 Tax=Enterobacter cloacae TaxID=550 RepID=A0A1S6XY93_ENTCL|nr:TraC conjugal transfer protein [Enterobacter cloacae]
MSFVDSLMDMLKNGKEEDGAATARNNLSQTWDYPSLVAALPYRYYDDKNEIFVNAGSAGFIMEAAPLPGANEQVMAALDDMLRKKLPRQTPVTVIMLASKCVGERIDRGVSNDMWKPSHVLRGAILALYEMSQEERLAIIMKAAGKAKNH